MLTPDELPQLKPFADDKLERKEFAEAVYRLIQYRSKGVISIDGAWGVGKTYFGENLKKLIEKDANDTDEKNAFKVLWVDAFEADWIDDPALTLIATFGALLDDEAKEGFFNSVVPLISKALPKAVHLITKAVGKTVGLDQELIDDVADVFKEQSAELVKKKLQELSERKKTLEALKKLISDFLVKSDIGKLVVFVDELDRCSPEYAIRLLERLKHLFDINGVIFILLWNQDQIANAVKAFYGSETNGQMYLDKFVDHRLSLDVTSARRRDDGMKGILTAHAEQMDPELRKRLNDTWVSTVSLWLRLNAREAQRLTDWCVMSGESDLEFLTVWLRGLKAKHPQIYKGIQFNEKSAHKLALDLLSNIESQSSQHRGLTILMKIHASYVTGKFDEADIEFRELFPGVHLSTSELMFVLLHRIEKTID